MASDTDGVGLFIVGGCFLVAVPGGGDRESWVLL